MLSQWGSSKTSFSGKSNVFYYTNQCSQGGEKSNIEDVQYHISVDYTKNAYMLHRAVSDLACVPESMTVISSWTYNGF